VVNTLTECQHCLTGINQVLKLSWQIANNNLKLVAVDLQGYELHKAVEVDLRKVQTMASDQTLFNADFAETITGLSPVTNQEDIIQDINSLFLFNDSPGQINFVDDNSMAFNAILASD
jgi:hypothetical protein